MLAHDAVRLLGGAVLSGALFVLLIGVPTDLIDTAVFGREVPPTWWAWPSLLLSSALAGLLVASYVASPARSPNDRTATRGGWAGTALTFFAVGCPVCNKLVLLALGTAGAMTWFEPVQPLLQVAAVVLLGWVLRQRLNGELSCPAILRKPMPEPRTSRKSPILPLAVAVLAAVALLATLFCLPGGGGADDDAPAAVVPATKQSEAAPSDDPLAQLARRQCDDPMAKGDVDAPVVLVAYSEFQCPFCGKWARDTAPILAKKYVADGTLRIEWRDFPYLGPESTTAALAGRAAAALEGR